MGLKDTEEYTIPRKVNVWDCAAVKVAMDDSVKHILINEFGFVEDFKYLDIRLALSFSTLLIALFAVTYDYIYPYPTYPTSKTVVLVCVIWYSILMLSLSFYIAFVEKGIFFLAKEHVGDGKNYNVWKAISELPQYSDRYSLTITKKIGEKDSKQEVLKRSVANFFTEDGVVVKRNVRKMLKTIHGRMEKNINE